MRIAIDARELLGNRTGVGRYLAALCAEWRRLPSHGVHQFVLYGPIVGDTPALLGEPFGDGDNGPFRYQAVPGDGGTWWEQTRLATALNASDVDVLFAPGYGAPLRARVPLALTIHDISFETHPEWFPWREGLRRRWMTRQSARRAARIVAVSGFTRDEIVTHLGVPRERVSVIWSGLHHMPPPSPVPREALVLYVGSIFNRRHVPELITAFKRVVAACPDAQLALVGDNRSHPRQDIDGLAQAAGLAGCVRVRAYVDEAELWSLYGRARAFVFLSEYEGFGFAPLEAMAAGVPTIVGDTSVAREVYGDAARRVGVQDIPGIAAAIIDLLSDTAAREQLCTAAAGLLPRFTWARAAAETLTVLEEVGQAR
ncbi:MAG: glycosyltransferase family 1 protein [Acidobacteria bacterium]|nr:glycosyltransferase family 1 protein [Acidobacteriota bacterium]